MAEPQVAAPIGIGLVGAGWFGAFCLAAYAGMPEVEVVAVADEDLGRAGSVAPAGASTHADLQGLLTDERVELVHIATPPASHAPMALAALRAGRHVFVEKPLATSAPDAGAVRAEARDRGLQVGIDYVLRHHPLHELALRLAGEGVLGDPLSWSLENFAAAQKLGPDHWFWDRRISGGIHVEHGIHFFDLCQQLAGTDPPSSVDGWSQSRPDGLVDRVGATVLYGDRLAATFTHGFVRSDRFERTAIRIVLRRGELALEGWIPTELRLWGAATAVEIERLRKESASGLAGALEVGQPVDEPFLAAAAGGASGQLREVSAVLRREDRWADYRRGVQAGMRDFVRAIRGGSPARVSIEDAMLSLETALRATTEPRAGAR
jgi:predicted dehydrogenase